MKKHCRLPDKEEGSLARIKLRICNKWVQNIRLYALMMFYSIVIYNWCHIVADWRFIVYFEVPLYGSRDNNTFQALGHYVIHLFWSNCQNNSWKVLEKKDVLVVPTKNITRVPASPLLGFPTIGIPPNSYCLLSVWPLLDWWQTDSRRRW